MQIELSQGKIAEIDDADWPLIAPYRWYAVRHDRRWYAVALPIGGNARSTKLRMHNLILGTKPVDHRDGNGLNNRRSNLRRCTNTQNQWNTKSRSGTSAFKGVSWSKRKQKWAVQITAQRKSYFGGYHQTETEAAKAANELFRRHHGPFAVLNPV